MKKAFLHWLCVLISVCLITTPAVADFIWVSDLSEDGTVQFGDDWERTCNSDSSYVHYSTGYVTTAQGDSENILLHSEDTSNWTGSGPWTQTVAVTAGWWKVETHLSGATITVEADTATIDASASATHGTPDWFQCTGAGDVTVTSDTADPKGMLYSIASGMEYGDDQTVSGITKANPGVVTITAHGLSTDDWVYFHDLTEMTELNDTVKQITKIDANSFSINDTSGYTTAETTGGSCAKQVPNYTDLTTPNTYVKTEATSATIPGDLAIGPNGGQKNPAFVQLNPYSNSVNEWTGKTRLNITTPTLVSDPSGGTDGFPFIPDTTEDTSHYVRQAIDVTVDDTTYCCSLFIRAGTPISGQSKVWARLASYTKVPALHVTDFNITDGTVGTLHSADYYGIDDTIYYDSDGNPWRRIWIADDVESGGTTPAFYLYIGESDGDTSFTGDNSTVSFWIWGMTVTQSTYPLPPVYSNSSMVAVAADSWTATLSAAHKTDLANIATITGEFTPGWSKGDITGDVNILDFGDLEIYYDDTNGMFEITDGTNTSTVSVNIVRNTKYYLAARLDDTADAGSGDLNIAYSTDQVTWTVDASDLDFDNGLTIADSLEAGSDDTGYFSFQNCMISDEEATDAQLPGLFCESVYDIDDGTVGGTSTDPMDAAGTWGIIGDDTTYQWIVFDDSEDWDVGGIGNTIDHITAYEAQGVFHASDTLTNSIYYSPVSNDNMLIDTGVTVTGLYNIIGHSNDFDGTFSDGGATTKFSTDPKLVSPDNSYFGFHTHSDALFGASDGGHIGAGLPYGERDFSHSTGF